MHNKFTLFLFVVWALFAFNDAFFHTRQNAILSKLKVIIALNEASSDSTPSPAPSSGIKEVLQADVKQAMKDKNKEKLAGIRAIQTAIKQREVDDRVVINDEEAVAIMSKLVKQRKESIKSYSDSGRQDLVAQEEAELAIIQSYMPKQLSQEDIDKIIDETIARLGAVTIKDMGKVMADLKANLIGKADIGSLGDALKKKLGAAK